MAGLSRSDLAIASICILALIAVAAFLGLAYGILLLSLISALSGLAMLRWMWFEMHIMPSGTAEDSLKADGISRYRLGLHTALLLACVLLSILWAVTAVALIAQGNPRLSDLLAR
jgi:hypothetical protein